MYQPIKLSEPEEKITLESFSLDPVLGKKEPTNIFTEAVFKDGKNSLKPIEEQFQVIKDLLDSELSMHDSSSQGKDKFDPEKFIKNLAWKELEDRMTKIFGFRNIDIMHWNEKYLGKEKDFESMELNCYTWPTWRYPIDGLVTDKGFYDTTRSINTSISYSLGTLKQLSATELTAVFLHELGHNLDPALVDINYTKTNILSKYLTDREGSINDQEKKVAGKSGKLNCIEIIIGLFYGSIALFVLISIIMEFINSFRSGFDKEKAITLIKEAVAKDKDKFTRQSNQEAFADNFARMYGYGSSLISALSKMRGHYDNQIQSRYTKEQSRQRIISELVMSSLKGVHKTDMHRAHSLIKEYEADLKDPSIPPKVKEAIKQDLDELNKLVDEYLNSSDDFSNQLNKIIYDELNKMDPNITKESKDDNKSEGKAAFTTESVLFAECIEPFDEAMALVDEKTLRPINFEEQLIAKRLFGSVKCAFYKDKHGYFATNSRARTSFYPTLESIPKAKVNFVSNLGRDVSYA